MQLQITEQVVGGVDTRNSVQGICQIGSKRCLAEVQEREFQATYQLTI